MEVSLTENRVGRSSRDVCPRGESGCRKVSRRSREMTRDGLHNNKFMRSYFVGSGGDEEKVWS